LARDVARTIGTAAPCSVSARIRISERPRDCAREEADDLAGGTRFAAPRRIAMS